MLPPSDLQHIFDIRSTLGFRHTINIISLTLGTQLEIYQVLEQSDLNFQLLSSIP